MVIASIEDPAVIQKILAHLVGASRCNSRSKTDPIHRHAAITSSIVLVISVLLYILCHSGFCANPIYKPNNKGENYETL
jgi:hypothetical protein